MEGGGVRPRPGVTTVALVVVCMFVGAVVALTVGWWIGGGL